MGEEKGGQEKLFGVETVDQLHILMLGEYLGEGWRIRR